MKTAMIVLWLVMLLALTPVHSEESLAIVGDFKAKPKNWLNGADEPKGIMIDLLTEVMARTGIVFSFELYPWNRAYTLSENGQAAIIGFSKTTEREKQWDYSDPMYFDELVFVTTKAKKFEYRGLESLKGRRVAIKIGASYGDDFELARKNKYFDVTETTDRAGQMRMLSADRVDLVLMSPGRIALETVISSNDWLAANRDNFIILTPVYKNDPNYLGIPKSMNKSHLLPAINKALKNMKSDGTHKKIVDRNINIVVRELRGK